MMIALPVRTRADRSWSCGLAVRTSVLGTRNGAIQALIATTFQNVETSRDDPTLDLLVELAESKGLAGKGERVRYINAVTFEYQYPCSGQQGTRGPCQ